jgi:hypothetical protein
MNGFTPPFHYDANGQFIFDRNNVMIAEVRGFAHLNNQFGAEEASLIQDQIGEFLTASLNEGYHYV